jgi:membrane protease YdiL (CAAX protease family)
MPVFFVGLLPALAPFLPGAELRSAIVLIPVANIALAARDILIGTFDWPFIAAAWLVTAGAAAWTTRASVSALSSEEFLTSSSATGTGVSGGAAQFERDVLRWFVGLWAVFAIVNGYYPAGTDIRVQAAINILGLFFGTTLLMLWRHKLSPRVALSLRAPRPMVWPAVAIGVPAAWIAALTLYKFADRFLPMPQSISEAMARSFSLEGIPTWQVFLFLAVVPGIFEELAFRGVLLHGLRRRLRPAALALVVGVIFGIFHFSLFRLTTTSFLGVILAAVTLLTGSIFPAMLWHVGNNAFAVVISMQGVDPLEHTGPMQSFAAFAALAASFWIIWRNRTPCPGLRPWRRPRPR